MKWLWVAGACVVLAAGIYTFIQEMRMHEYCRVYSPESWGWGDAGDAEMRANIWPEEMSRTIHVRLTRL
ncbi:hypothetical protein DN062_04240 [Nitrincola tibetensis]|uniref:Uncharacterized protein n=1 Tax=Nitrincola tibetensis TaxID=2219697 RepID=A0A364NQT1_9GAMM|nr:hypothetical protein [Nitrincola tibetensis]RAU19468.1 hypothetical protein DN062_04240 [Nitrincola tibetensis]